MHPIGGRVSFDTVKGETYVIDMTADPSNLIETIGQTQELSASMTDPALSYAKSRLDGTVSHAEQVVSDGAETYGQEKAALQAAVETAKKAIALFEEIQAEKAYAETLGAEPLVTVKSVLQTAISAAENALQKDTDYTEEIGKLKEALEKALGAAQKINDDSGEDEVSTAYRGLQTAFNNLKSLADKDSLKNALDKTKYILDNIKLFAPSSVAGLETTYHNAKKIYDREDATQAEVDEATAKLAAANAKARVKEDKTALIAALQKAAGYQPETYTPVSWSTVKGALEAAQALLPDDDATQEAVDGAYGTLAQAIVHLTLRAQTNSLNVAIELAQTIVSQLDRYAPATVEGLQEKLDAAKAVQGNLNATQEEVDAAAKALAEAAAKARLKANKKDLQQAYAQAQKLDPEKYTEESVKQLSRVLAATETVLKNENATQQEVDKAKDALTDAIQTLEVKPTSGTENSSSPDDNSSNDGTGTVDTTQTGTSDQNKAESPQTGEPFPISVPIGSAAALILCTFLIYRNRKASLR